MAKSKKAGKVKTGTINVTYNGPINPVTEKDLDTLRKECDLARIRYTHAVQQRMSWAQEEYSRAQEFNIALRAYTQKQHSFTDDQIEKNPVKTAMWTYDDAANS